MPQVAIVVVASTSGVRGNVVVPGPTMVSISQGDKLTSDHLAPPALSTD